VWYSLTAHSATRDSCVDPAAQPDRTRDAGKREDDHEQRLAPNTRLGASTVNSPSGRTSMVAEA